MEKTAGILLSITSLPSKYGIGCFSKEAYEFVDFLRDSGQSMWQVLPLGPTGYGDSPYQSFSSFAGNPYLISLEDLCEEGVLSAEMCEHTDWGADKTKVDYEKIYNSRFTLLRTAYENTDLDSDEDFRKFRDEEGFWLSDYALFMALKVRNQGREWQKWDKETACEKDEIEFWEYVQYKFYSQWFKIKEYANENGISIIGDIPIYAAYDSADVWASPELFELDEDGIPTAVAGCPPDGFSAEGQLWGNPLYQWEAHKKDGFSWWKKRLSHSLRMYDILRIDHFRGFDQYYSIPYGSENAVNGEWRDAPGRELFSAAESVTGSKIIIAEDLGFITESVKELLSDCGFLGMKVLEFAFDARDDNDSNMYLPHNYPEKCVAYTATHDNEPMVSWFAGLSDYEKEKVREYLCDFYTPEDKIVLPLISRIMQSNAQMCIIPIQDYMQLGEESRMNTPQTLGGNWMWRIKSEDLSDSLKTRIRTLTKTYSR